MDPKALAERVDLSVLTRSHDNDCIVLRTINEAAVRAQIEAVLKDLIMALRGTVKETRPCPVCGRAIEVGGGTSIGSKRSDAVYCSRSCQNAAYYERKTDSKH